MESIVKSKIALMIIVLGLIVAIDKFAVPMWFVYLFDTLGFVVIITLLYGVRKDTGTRITAEERAKVCWVLFLVAGAMTFVCVQLIPKPLSWSVGGAGLALMGYLLVAYKEELKKV